MRAHLALVLCFAGCDGTDTGLAETGARAEAHLQAFWDFDRWARRALDGQPAHASEAAYETVFAKVRSQPSVLGAWVAWGSPRALMSLPRKAQLPSSPPWVRLRTRQQPLRAAVLARCPEGLLDRGSEPARSCVLLERSAPAAQSQITVTVLFGD